MSNISSDTKDYSFLIREKVRELHEYVPGRSIEEIAQLYNLKPEEILKLGSNENVLGPSQKVLDIIEKERKNVHLYPSTTNEELRREIAKFIGFGFTKDNIALGAGMDGVLDTLARILIDPGDEVIINVPTFSYYELACSYYGANIVPVMRDANFDIDFNAIIDAITPKTKIVFICSPNNPSGNTINENFLRDFLTYLHQDILVFIDEAYYDFSKDGSVVDLLLNHSNVIIGRTFSKVYALAGLRVGYMVADNWLTREYYKAATPFVINHLAEKAAVAAIKDHKHTMDSLMLGQRGVEQYRQGLKFRTYPSNGNFIMVNTSPLKAKDVTARLAKKGIIVRDCTSFKYLGDTYLRITSGRKEDNQRVIDELNAIYDEAGK